jgi:hypothetical protein
MTGPFIQLSEAGTGKPILINLSTVTSFAPHGRSGAYVLLLGEGTRLEVDETPADIAGRLEAAGLTCQPQSAIT